MTNRITADQARNLTQAHDPAFAVDAILEGVKVAAKKGKYEYVTRSFGFGDSACYASEDKWPPLCQAIVKELRDLGYSVRGRAQENQFVDLWLEVKWGPGK